MTMGRMLLAVAVVFTVSVSGMAERQRQFHVKPAPSSEKSAAKSAPILKAPAGATSTSKQLSAIEKESNKTVRATRTPKQRTVAATKPQKAQANPPINFGAGTGKGGSGLIDRGSNPLKGRLKEKRGHH